MWFIFVFLAYKASSFILRADVRVLKQLGFPIHVTSGVFSKDPVPISSDFSCFSAEDCYPPFNPSLARPFYCLFLV